ncbi:MAG: alcohol dehydrogenase catalytic domain-containing protein [Myxococcales bacterium]|nr:alcohol dehydrogenase catalytic domain-containing protein [Myxococcales bacterium]
MASAETVRAFWMDGPEKAELRDVPRPGIGAADGLLRVEMAGVCGTDLKIYRGRYAGRQGWPLIPGHEICGVIEELGDEAAARWGVAVGDRVALDSFLTCGLCEACMAGNSRYCTTLGDYGVSMSSERPPHLWGGFAERVYLDRGAQVHALPEGCSFELGVLVPAVVSNALRWVGDVGGVSLGSRLLIQGPGPIGLASVVVARALGAATVLVSGLPEDAARLALARELGADAAVHAGPELEEAVAAATAGEGVDVVLEVSGAPSAIAAAPSLVRRQGTIVLAGLSGGHSAALPCDLVALQEIAIKGVFSHDRAAVKRGLAFATERREIFDAFVTHRYPLEETAEAIEVVGSGDPNLIKSVVLPAGV